MSFCSDGHTIAVGASNSGAILVYDLRKSSKAVYKLCTGHTQTINSLNFANKLPAARKKEEDVPEGRPVSSSMQREETKQFKSINQIKEEARVLAE